MGESENEEENVIAFDLSMDIGHQHQYKTRLAKGFTITGNEPVVEGTVISRAVHGEGASGTARTAENPARGTRGGNVKICEVE